MDHGIIVTMGPNGTMVRIDITSEEEASKLFSHMAVDEDEELIDFMAGITWIGCAE